MPETKLKLCQNCSDPVPNRKRKYCDKPECRRAAKGSHMKGNRNGEALRGVPKSPETRKRMKEAFAKRGSNPSAGRPKSLEWKRKMAERIRAGKVGFRTSKRAKYVRADGRQISCRSLWEYAVAEWLDGQDGMEWEYEPEVLVLGDEVYLPDFRVKQGELVYYIEVKGYFPPEQRSKMERFSACYDIRIWKKEELESRGILRC